jgi:tetratricopeptide (TPR) repeat protein
VNFTKNIGLINGNIAAMLLKMSRHVSMLLLLLFLSSTILAQSDVSIFGVVRDHGDNKKISGVTITIYQDGVKFNTEKSNSSGKYEFIIGFEHEYKIVYTFPNYVTKHVTLDTRYVPEEEKEIGYQMTIDMTLFQEIEGLDVSILDNPIGKAQYYAKDGKIGWDGDYTRQMQSQISALMREHDKKLEEEAARLAKMEEDFKELVRKGDEAVRNQKFADAVDLYTDALVLFPKDEPVQTKKAEAEKAVALAQANQEKEDKYNAFINSGDKYFGTEEWENALSSYESANQIFPDESYPKTRIKEVNDILDGIRKNAANETMVAKLIKEGDASVNQEKFDDGIAKYTEALSLIPGHKLATEQLAAAKEKKTAWLALQKEAQNYADLIAKADGEFNANDFRGAITTYTAALKIKANEKYPKDQIAKAEGILGDAAAEAEKKKQFTELVKQGDSKVNATKYQEGIDVYKQALAIYPSDEGVQQKISDAQAAMANMMAAGEKEEKYKALIARADKALVAKQYESAKSSYQEALTVKTNEPYPQQKINEIDGIIAGLAASKDAAAKKALQEKFDKIVAQGDDNAIKQSYNEAINKYEEALDLIPGVAAVEEKIAEAKRKQQDLMANKALDEQYNEWIAKGDKYFTSKKYEQSKDAYLESLLLMDKTYPKERIAEIDKLLKDLALQADQDERMKEFARLEKEGDDYVSQEDYQSGIDSYSAALEIMNDQAVVDKKALAEKNLSALNMSMAFAEQYNAIIAKADAAFSEKNYNDARALYQKAFGVMAEDYPKNRIKEIDRLLLEEERRHAEDEAARLASVKTDEEWNSNTSDEERYIKEAEEEQRKIEDSNYAELLAYKAAIKKTNENYADNGESLRAQNASVIASEREKNVDMFSVGEDMHDKNVYVSNTELSDYNVWLAKKNQEQISASKDTYAQLVNEQKELREEQSYSSEKYKEYARQVKDQKEEYQNFNYTKSEAHANKIRRNYYQSQELAKEQYRVFSEGTTRKDNMRAVEYEKRDSEEFLSTNQREQDDRIKNYKEDADAIRVYQKEQIEDDLLEVKESYKELHNESEMREVEEDRWKNRSEVRREQANDDARNTDYSGKKDYEDYQAGTLAQTYQQGVTEETYEEGNAKVVKRVVVKGNKADEYKMVVMRSGTYYFKNGASISKTTWNNDTEEKASYMD